MTSSKRQIHYVTSSGFKIEENNVFTQSEVLKDGTKVSDAFDFVFRSESIKEMLEVDLRVMVQAEVVDAYSRIKVPCIVEHAGIIFDEFSAQEYPGGLTKPMWNTLADDFLKETNSANRRAKARAVIAYCDGKTVQTFVGETSGRLADAPRGSRRFYWDTVFIPDKTNGKPGTKTYAEIVEDPKLGLAHKMREYSQSAKAMRAFLEYLLKNPSPDLWQH